MQKKVIRHISFWMVYVLFKTFQNLGSDLTGISGFAYQELIKAFTAQLAFLIIKVPMVYVLFYITEEYLAKRFTITKTLLSGFLLFILSLAIFLPVKQFIVLEGIYKIKSSLSAALNFTSIIYSLFILFFVSSVALTIKLVRSNIRQKDAEQELIKKKLETELQFLKAQTNPHFLFNTLNNIYALARKKSDRTPDVVMKLSKLLRFMLYESQKESIPIVDEIQVLDDYIELEKIRHSSNLKLSFTRSVTDEKQSIAPLILLPFVENAFKHGASESRFGAEINIQLTLQQGVLFFSVENTIPGDINQFNSEKLGLKNIKRQLDLLYPDHQLNIDNDKSHFAVTLKINLSQGVRI